MKLFTSGRYAAVASTAALVAALGGTSYAAAQISGGDIKDGSISTSDLARRRRPRSSRSTTTRTPRSTAPPRPVLSFNLKPGSYLLARQGQHLRERRRVRRVLADRSGRPHARLRLLLRLGQRRRRRGRRPRRGPGHAHRHRPAELRGLQRLRGREEADRHLGGVGHQPDRRERRQGASPAAPSCPSAERSGHDHASRRTAPPHRAEPSVVPPPAERTSGSAVGCRMPGSILGTEVRRVEDRRAPARSGHVRRQPRERRRRARDLRPQPVRPRPDHRHRHLGRRGRRAGCWPSSPPTTSAASRSPGFADVNDQAGRAALAVDKVRYVGDPVALVVAETRAQAMDAAELVDVDYDDLPVVTDMEDALADDAPLQFEAIGSNIATPARGQGHRPTCSTTPTTSPACGWSTSASPPPRSRATRSWSGRPADGMEVWVSTQHPHMARDLLAKAIGVDAAARPRRRAPRRRRLRRQGRHRPRPRRDRAGRPAARPSGEVVGDPERGDALDAGPRPGAVRRARAHRATARSPACGCGCSASAGRTPASAARSRSDRRT